MAGLSTYYEDVVVNHLFRNLPFTPPANMHCALFTVAPDDEGGGTEVSGGGYNRIVFSFLAPVSGVTSNGATIEFPIATTNWGTLVAVGIFDALVGGNLLGWANLAVPKTIETGDQFRIDENDIDLTID